MLTHPTHETADHARLDRNGQSPPGAATITLISTPCRSRSASDCWSIAKPPSATPKRLTTRLKFAALRQSACVEDLDWRTPRGIDRGRYSPDSSAATGSTATRTCSSRGQPGSARAGLPAPSATRPAAIIVRSSISRAAPVRGPRPRAG